MEKLALINKYDDPEFREAIYKKFPEFRHKEKYAEYCKYADQVIASQNQRLLEEISMRLLEMTKALVALHNKIK